MDLTRTLAGFGTALLVTALLADPAIAGPAVAGPAATTGPTATGSAATGPATTGSAATGSAATGSAATGSAATGAPSPGSPSTRDFGNGADRNEIAAVEQQALATRTLLNAPATAPWTLTARKGYPRRTALPVWPDNPDDRSIKLGLVPYHAIAPRLNALQKSSDRVSAEIVGKSAGGRDLYLVTVTAPETRPRAPGRTAGAR